MAADYIKLNKALPLSQLIVSLAENIRNQRELADKINDIVNHSVDGSDYTVLESLTGVSTTYSGNLSTLVLYMQEIFNTNADVTGANRLARMEEFVSRLAGQ